MTSAHHTSLVTLLSAPAVVALQDRSTMLWHATDQGSEADSISQFMDAVVEQHLANFELWHIEDQARAPRASARQIAELKHAIDRTNQRRNDLMERCDSVLLEALSAEGLPSPDAELQSESP